MKPGNVEVQIGSLRLVATAISDHSTLVRIHPNDGPHYDRMIVVVVEGDTLYLMGWIGKLLTISEWSAAARVLFPGARKVTWERLQADGSLRNVTVAMRQNRAGSAA